MSQSQDKQLQKGRIYEQVLIVPLEFGEAGQPVSPAFGGLHRAGEKPVEELDVLCVRGGGGRVGGAELFDHRQRRNLHKAHFSTNTRSYLIRWESVGGYLAVVKLSGRAVGISPEESREQTERGRGGRRLCLQGALWFGGQAASAALQAICTHHCEEENGRRQKEKVSLLVVIGAASFLTFHFPSDQLDVTVHPLHVLSDTGS